MNKLTNCNYFEVSKTYDNRILEVIINRPPVNAFIKESYEELSSIINYANTDPELCVMVLKSNGKHFSAGADVKKLQDDSAREASIRRATLRKSGADLYSCNIPVIAAVNGAAIGAGSVFAGSADVIIASECAQFSIPEINHGIVGGAKGLSRIFPPQKIRVMALTGMKVSAQEAYRLGGVEAIVSLDELHSKALEYAEKISDKGSTAVRKWKESLLITENVGAAEGLYIEQCLSQEAVPFYQDRN